jgi:hypothetical protein
VLLLAEGRVGEHVVQIGEDRLGLLQLLLGEFADLVLESPTDRVETLAPPRAARLPAELRQRHRPHQAGVAVELAAGGLEGVGDVVEALRVALPKQLAADPATGGLEQLLARRRRLRSKVEHFGTV